VTKKKNQLPPDWATVPLRELLVALESGKRPRGGVKNIKSGIPSIGGEHLNANGGFKFEKIKYVSEEFADGMVRGHIQRNDILIVKDGATTGKTSLVKNSFPHKKAVVNEHVFLCRCAKEVDSLYLFYFLFSLEGNQQILNDFRGAAQGGISKGFADIVKVPSAPQKEQERISCEIEKQFSRLDEAVENLKRVKANLKRYKASVLKAAVEGKLTEEWRKANPNVEPASKLLEHILAERRKKWEETELAKMKSKRKEPKDDKWKKKFKKPSQVDESLLPALPNGWAWSNLPQLGELNRGKSKHRPRNAPFLYGGLYPFVQTGDVRHATGIINQYSQTYSEEGLKQSRLWTKGTLCITIAANIADTALLGFDACFPDSIVGFIPENENVDVRVIEYFIRTAKEDLERYAPATAQKNINLAILSDVAIPFPPKEEQHEIVDEIEKCLTIAEGIEFDIAQNMVRADRLRQSILKKAFSGKLIQNKEL